MADIKYPVPEMYRRAAARLRRWLKACVLCPRACKADRLSGKSGFCRAQVKAVVNTAQLHPGEEPPISGTRGSGTVFFAGCTLGCRFCQNYQISQEGWGEEIDDQRLAQVFLELQKAGAHNINLVTPTPHLVAILEALAIAREQGLAIPIVYNTSGYERAATIRALDGLIEIYMPDYKYGNEDAAIRLSDAKGYVRHASAALEEMFRQVGNLQLDDDGVATGGILVRHLVLPEGLAGTRKVLAELVRICGKGVAVSLMSQYFPAYKAMQTKGIARPVSNAEYAEARQALDDSGIRLAFVQSLHSANDELVPRFRR